MLVKPRQLIVGLFLVSAATFVGILALNGFPPTVHGDASIKGPAKDESWYVVQFSGKRIGYCQSIIETVEQNGKPVVKTSMIVDMTINRDGQRLNMKQDLSTQETLEGDLLSFRQEVANPPATSKITQGKVEGRQLVLTQETNGRPKTTNQPWTPGVKSPVYQDRVLKENPIKPGETRSFQTFNPELVKVDKVTLKGFDREDVKLLDNSTQRLTKVTSTQALLPGLVTESFLDENGDTVKISQAMFGGKIEFFRTSKKAALSPGEGGNFDLMISTLVKVKPIPQGHQAKRVVYRVTLKDEDPAKVIPSGNTQTIKQIDNRTAELTVVAAPIPQSAKIDKVDETYLESSLNIQSDDERVQALANQATGDATDPAEIARRMEKFVRRKVENKNFSTAMASAAEVARTLEGDCSEHAVLLAAMLRAKKIPARIAVGFLYVEHISAFSGHMWTEANLNGKWIPLDATLGQGGTGACHIKLADSSLSDNNLEAIIVPLSTIVGKIKLDVISSD